MASDTIVHVDTDTFGDEVLAAGLPVLVDFWAPWCGPCLAVSPVLDDLATELAGRLRIAKVNIDEDEELAFRFQVSSIPTFILFKDGQVADRMLGAMPKTAFRDFLERNL
jgi:thioredoxin 1